MGLPNDFRGIPVTSKPRQKWTAVTQGVDWGAGRSETRLIVQGANFPVARMSEGAVGGVVPPPDAGTIYVVGTPYFDARPELIGVVQTFDVENWSAAPPTEYLTDPATGLPSGISFSGAIVAGIEEQTQVISQGGDPTTIGSAQNEAQTILTQIAEDQGQLVGPGTGSADDDYLSRLESYRDAVRQQLAAETAAVQSGATPGSGWQGGTAASGSAATVTANQADNAKLLNGLLLVGAVFAVLKLLKVV